MTNKPAPLRKRSANARAGLALTDCDGHLAGVNESLSC
jgi:hypothetical protein